MVPETVTKCRSEDCEFRSRGSSTTLMAWFPTYDKHDNLINDDPNIITTRVDCAECDRVFVSTTRAGVTVWSEITDAGL